MKISCFLHKFDNYPFFSEVYQVFFFCRNSKPFYANFHKLSLFSQKFNNFPFSSEVQYLSLFFVTEIQILFSYFADIHELPLFSLDRPARLKFVNRGTAMLSTFLKNFNNIPFYRNKIIFLYFADIQSREVIEVRPCDVSNLSE